MPGMVPGLCRSLCFVHHLLPCTVPIDTQHQCSIRSSIYRFGCEFEASTVPATPWLEGAATWFYKMTTRSNTHTLSIYYIYGMDTLAPGRAHAPRGRACNRVYFHVGDRTPQL